MEIELEYSLGYASSGDSLFRDTGRLRGAHPDHADGRLAVKEV